ncbi:MAG TPA: hypothetical protein VN864_08535, partial [Thermoplasmata archaeon]|nr:hypothetical protein [Thermoplasmata archaeon]
MRAEFEGGTGRPYFPIADRTSSAISRSWDGASSSVSRAAADTDRRRSDSEMPATRDARDAAVWTMNSWWRPWG